MVCMQRKNYMPLALRNLLDREWRRVFLPELHALLEKCRPWLTEEMVERAANAVFRLLTEGHHQKDQTVRNGRIIFSLKNDPESIVNNAPAITYARFSSKIVPADLRATTEYRAARSEKVSETPPPAPIMPKQKKQPKKNAASKAPTKTPKNAARVSYSFKIFEERNDKHCTITSEALPLATRTLTNFPAAAGEIATSRGATGSGPTGPTASSCSSPAVTRRTRAASGPSGRARAPSSSTGKCGN